MRAKLKRRPATLNDLLHYSYDPAVNAVLERYRAIEKAGGEPKIYEIGFAKYEVVDDAPIYQKRQYK